MFRVACPSCGHPVDFKLESSIYSTCPSCQTVLMRTDLDVRNIGRAAIVQSDPSPLKIGTRGQFQGRSFEIIGRTQAIQPDGFWNEWFILFSDQTTGWLSESIGEYSLTVPGTLDNPPDFEAIKLGQTITQDGVEYIVANKGQAEVVAFEGELNFKPDGSYDLYYADLRTYRNLAATIDYSDFKAGEGPVEFFYGTYQEFEEFQFTNLRDEEDIIQRENLGTRSFNCPHCGGDITIRSGVNARSCVCEYCGSALDLSTPNAQLLFTYDQQLQECQLLIPLGKVGRFQDVEWTLVGFQHKYMKEYGRRYYWDEYLLYNRLHGYRYLQYEGGHWSLNRIIHDYPTLDRYRKRYVPLRNVDQDAYYRGRTYKHFSSYVGFVERVVGEFPYLVLQDEKSFISDYISPPQGLCSERNPEGIFWSITDYLTPQEVAQAFQMEELAAGPPPSKIGTLEPSRWRPKAVNATLHFVLLSVFLFLVMAVVDRRSEEIAHFSGKVQANREASYITPEFKVPGGRGNLKFEFKTSGLSNAWVNFETLLIDRQTDEARIFDVECLVYSGDTYKPDRSLILPQVEGGTYCLRINPIYGAGEDNTGTLFVDRPNSAPGPRYLSYTVTIWRNAAQWQLWLWLELLLSLWPIYAWSAYRSENRKRWWESDHSALDDDDDDD